MVAILVADLSRQVPNSQRHYHSRSQVDTRLYRQKAQIISPFRRAISPGIQWRVEMMGRWTSLGGSGHPQ